MGGYGSGRYGGPATTESGLTLSLPSLMRDRLFQPGCNKSGPLVWVNMATGEQVGSIGYEAQLGQDEGRVRLIYTTTRSNGEKHTSDYWLRLETTPQPLGGQRWWFICPRTGGRAPKLYLPNGASTFASRKAHQLAYPSQRETACDRALRSAFKLRGRLGAQGGIDDYVPKPKWMRWPTYERKLDEIAAAEEVVDAHLATFVRKLI